MIIYPMKKINRSKTVGGAGLVNKIINSLPIELHLPGQNYCGPGTKLEERLSKKISGSNKLDEACKSHDIFYFKNSELKKRHQADKELINRAWERDLAKDSSIGEKINSYIVTYIKKGKVKLGMGCRKKQIIKKKTMAQKYSILL